MDTVPRKALNKSLAYLESLIDIEKKRKEKKRRKKEN